MGDFVRHRHEGVHDILLEDAEGEKLGVVNVSASIHLSESYDHLRPENYGGKPAPPAGPATRRIVSETTGYAVYGRGWGVNEPPAPVSEILSSLKEHGGLAGEEPIPYTDARFPDAFTDWAESTHGCRATFR